MCWFSKTVEEIIAQNSVGMTDAQKAEYWYELTQNIFAILGKVDAETFEISTQEWIAVAQAQYPTLTDIKFADSKFFTTNLSELQEILKRDWTNLVPYVAEISDCDKFATRLYSHLCDYYKINKRLAPDVYGCTPALPLPGTELRRLVKDKGHLVAQDYEDYMLGQIVLGTDELSTDDIREVLRSFKD